jgi:hypothetical protein
MTGRMTLETYRLSSWVAHSLMQQVRVVQETLNGYWRLVGEGTSSLLGQGRANFLNLYDGIRSC